MKITKKEDICDLSSFGLIISSFIWKKKKVTMDHSFILSLQRAVGAVLYPLCGIRSSSDVKFNRLLPRAGGRYLSCTYMLLSRVTIHSFP